LTFSADSAIALVLLGFGVAPFATLGWTSAALVDGMV